MLGTVYQYALAVIAIAVIAALLSIVFRSWRNGISPMPASASVRRATASEVKRIGGEPRVLEAGSGWGTLALYLARHTRATRVIGVENSWVPLWSSRLLTKLFVRSGASSGAVNRVAFLHGDLYTASYSDYDIIICYLYPGAMKRLGPLLLEKAAPGTHIISICFALPEWQPDRVVTCSDVYRTKIYVYRIKQDAR